MLVEDIRKNAEIKNNIRWDLTPEIVGRPREIRSKEDYERITKELESMSGYYFYIDVWDCQARLVLMQNNPDGSGISNVITDFTENAEDALIEAVEEAGGAINMSGHYPINSWIKKLILFMIPKIKGDKCSSI